MWVSDLEISASACRAGTSSLCQSLHTFVRFYIFERVQPSEQADPGRVQSLSLAAQHALFCTCALSVHAPHHPRLVHTHIQHVLVLIVCPVCPH